MAIAAHARRHVTNIDDPNVPSIVTVRYISRYNLRVRSASVCYAKGDAMSEARLRFPRLNLARLNMTMVMITGTYQQNDERTAVFDGNMKDLPFPIDLSA